MDDCRLPARSDTAPETGIPKGNTLDDRNDLPNEPVDTALPGVRRLREPRAGALGPYGNTAARARNPRHDREVRPAGPLHAAATRRREPRVNDARGRQGRRQRPDEELRPGRCRQQRQVDNRKKRELEAAAINRACGRDARRLHEEMTAAREAARPDWEITTRIRAVQQRLETEQHDRLFELQQERERTSEREHPVDRSPVRPRIR